MRSLFYSAPTKVKAHHIFAQVDPKYTQYDKEHQETENRIKQQFCMNQEGKHYTSTFNEAICILDPQLILTIKP